MRTIEVLIQVIRTIEDREWDYRFITYEVLDRLFDIMRVEVEQSLILLNTARANLKQSMSAASELLQYQTEQRQFLDMLEQLNKVTNPKLVAVIRLIKASEELVKESTRRKVLSKLPVEPIDYLHKHHVTSEDVDWIVGKIKDYWQKFCQVYSSARVELVLKIRAK